MFIILSLSGVDYSLDWLPFFKNQKCGQFEEKGIRPKLKRLSSIFRLWSTFFDFYNILSKLCLLPFLEFDWLKQIGAIPMISSELVS